MKKFLNKKKEEYTNKDNNKKNGNNKKHLITVKRQQPLQDKKNRPKIQLKMKINLILKVG